MKLGLGLSLPGVAAMGGKSADRILATAKHRYDARLGSSWTDQGSGGVNGTGATGITHDGSRWWTFAGSGRVDLWAPSSIPTGASDNATVLTVFRRTSTSVPTGTEVLISSKDNTTASTLGWHLRINTAGRVNNVLGDGVDSSTKTDSTGPTAEDSTLIVVFLVITPTTHELYVNGELGSGSTSKGSVDGATAGVIANVRVGANAGGTSNPLNGDIGLIAGWTSALTADDRLSITSLVTAAWA